MNAEELLARCFLAIQSEGASALERFCHEHPDLADEARKRHAQVARLLHSSERPARIGPFEILGEVGRGGMGIIYHAVQREPVVREVAIKLIKEGMDTRETLARFSFERQTLARLDHRYIARLYDAGSTELGRPFFVMEFVHGVPLTAYCAEHRLTIRERVELFIKICEGVEHAHQNGVIHRDLKPSNILVSSSDEGRAEPHIIDFGIARLLHPLQDMPGMTAMTTPGAAVGTPEYMSPEQAGANPSLVDTRTDVYAIGVMLYEAMSGALPFDGERLRNATPEQRKRIIEVETPPRPSQRASRAASAALAERNCIHARRLTGQLDRELDWITLKCLHKDPGERYASARDLGLDLARFLRGEAVTAGPPTTTYRLRKLLRRHRGTATLGALLLLSIVGGLVGTSVGFFRATEKSQLLQRKIDEYDLLALSVSVDEVAHRADALGPALPSSIDRLSAWTRDYEALERALPRIEAAVVELRARTLDGERTVGTTSGEPSDELSLAEEQLRGIQLLARGRTSPLAEIQLEESETAATAKELIARVVRSIGNGRDWRPAADGARQLALARVALTKVETGDSSVDLRPALNTLAWATFGTGRFEEARAIMDRLLASDPAPELRFEILPMSAKLDLLARQLSGPGLQRWIQSRESDIARRKKARTAAVARRFANDAERFLHDTLCGVEQRILELGTEIRPKVRDRLEFARQVAEVSLERHRDRWQAARLAIATADDVTASARYRSEPPLVLEPQVGVVPIGMNPVTKLWEFYDLRSAWDPVDGRALSDVAIPTHQPDGSIDITPTTGIVFVLLPGATFSMGAQRLDERRPNFDAGADLDESPVHEVTLHPFMIARHELTRGQWMRLADNSDPSTHAIGATMRGSTDPISYTHPVETVDWTTARRALSDAGMTLPTEAQWEYACRAGSGEAWFTGSKRESLAGFANLADATAKRYYPNWNNEFESFDDGRVVAAPVGSYAANAFGLFDVVGNVWEFCEGGRSSYEIAPEVGTGLRGEQATEIVFRGACWNSPASMARSASRADAGRALKGPQIGVRAARRVTLTNR